MSGMDINGAKRENMDGKTRESKRNDTHDKILNLPNTLTALRIVLITAFLIAFARVHTTASIVFFLLAAITDMLDGWAARRLNQVTEFGKILDPIADKYMIVSALAALAIRRWSPWWLLAVVAAKELLMLTGGLILLRRGVVIQSNNLGKAATALFIAAIVTTFFHNSTSPYDLILQVSACALNIAALCVYAADAYAKLRGAKV